MKKIYFASPFFNEEQVEREERLKKKLRDLGYNVFSPKENIFLSKDATDEEQEKAYSDNIKNIETCDILFGVTDGKDMGTIWECGYANGINSNRKQKIKIIYYCETLNGGQFNLMLAKSADAVITSYKDMDNFSNILERGNAYEGYIE